MTDRKRICNPAITKKYRQLEKLGLTVDFKYIPANHDSGLLESWTKNTGSWAVLIKSNRGGGVCEGIESYSHENELEEAFKLACMRAERLLKKEVKLLNSWLEVLKDEN